MRISVADIVRRDNLVGQCLLGALSGEQATQISAAGYADVRMTVNGEEIDIAGFVQRWQDGVEREIAEAAAERMAGKFDKVRELVDTLEDRLTDSLRTSFPEEP